MKLMKYPKAHPWTLKKLEFLKRYLPAFVSATKKALSRHYVDGFAGPGYNQLEDGTLIEGSPLLAIQHSNFTSFFFVEKNRRSYAELERNIRERDSSLSGIHLYRGDFNLLVDDILQQIHPRAPTLFFLDPFGLELRWATVEKIAKREKADIFILISSSGANRAKQDHPQTLDDFFGGASWRTIQQKVGQSWFEAFTEAYRDRMRRLGLNGTELVTVARNSNNAPMHVLAFHSKKDIALHIANAVFSSIESNPTQPGLQFDE